MEKSIKPRLTTGEVARTLNCKQSAAVLLLRAASVPFTRTGKGAYFWDYTAVERLVANLRGPAKVGGQPPMSQASQG